MARLFDDQQRLIVFDRLAILSQDAGDRASVIRLDALGKRLTQMANLDNGEFDFGNIIGESAALQGVLPVLLPLNGSAAEGPR